MYISLTCTYLCSVHHIGISFAFKSPSVTSLVIYAKEIHIPVKW